MKTLLVVDVQNDFCPGGSLAVPEGDKVVPVINSLMDKFSNVVASKDWHPQQTVHFNKWPAHCVKETPGAEFHPLLDSAKIQKIFYKGTGNKDDGYSAFEATSEDLNDYLKTTETDELYITGLATDYCVKASALDAVRNGFQTIVVEDAIKGVEVNVGDTENAIQEMKEQGIKFIKAEEI